VSGTAVFAGLILSLVTGISSLAGGPPWPVDPTVTFRDTNDGSSFILPFDIRNNSAFRMPNVEFRCGVDFTWLRDAAGHHIFAGGEAFINGRKTVVSTATFDCDASKLFGIKPDGSLSARGSATAFENRSGTIYRPPFQAVKMCLWIGGTYNFLGIFPTSFTTGIFQWPAKPGSHQWLTMPFIGERPAEEIQLEKETGLIPGALACPEEVQYPYGLVTGAGYELLIFPPMPTGTLGIVPIPPTL
jgi:hypothetical protein